MKELANKFVPQILIDHLKADEDNMIMCKYRHSGRNTTFTSFTHSIDDIYTLIDLWESDLTIESMRFYRVFEDGPEEFSSYHFMRY